jgi:hypothetical protein
MHDHFDQRWMLSLAATPHTYLASPDGAADPPQLLVIQNVVFDGFSETFFFG